MMTNVKRLHRLSSLHDGYATIMWLFVAAMLSSLVMWMADSTTCIYDWMVWGILAIIFFLPGGVLLLILHLYHRYKINDVLARTCSEALFKQEVFHAVGKDLAISDNFLIYVSKLPVIVRRIDVQGVHLMNNKIILSTVNGPFAYVYPDETVIRAIETWAHAEWVCPACGAHMDASYVFCSECGYHREVVVEKGTKENRHRPILVVAMIILIVLAIVLVYCGMAKPVERKMDLEPDGYLAVPCEQMLNNEL